MKEWRILVGLDVGHLCVRLLGQDRDDNWCAEVIFDCLEAPDQRLGTVTAKTLDGVRIEAYLFIKDWLSQIQHAAEDILPKKPAPAPKPRKQSSGKAKE